MIETFMSGILNTIIYLFTKPAFWILLLVSACMLLVGAVYPGAIYLYPYWQSKIDNVPIQIYDDMPIEGINTTVVVPSRLIPDAERTYYFKVEFENTTDHEINLRYSLDVNKPYVSFLEVTELPIVDEVEISAGNKVAPEYEFRVSEATSPRDPVRFTLRASIDGDAAAKYVIIPIDYWSIPVAAIVGAIFATILAILRLLIKLIFGV